MSAERVDVVTHVHWDREWYRTFDAFRARLVELVDAVLDQLDRGELGAFLLDGQTCVVDDHLEIRPDAAPRLAEHIAAGRLGIGPWYVLADMTLVSGESLIRNLLLGAARADALGGRTDVGYCPDMFGHPPELPTLLNGFGIGTALVWRGADSDTPLFRWRGSDGSEVLTLRNRYYEPEVLWTADGAGDRFASWLADRRAEQPEGPWLLLNGGDHLAPRDLAATLAGLDAQVAVAETTLAGHLASLSAAAAPVVEGPLRRPGQGGAFLLAGTLSVRPRAKRANADGQALLEGVAEPLVAQAMLTAEPTGAARELTTTPSLRGLLDRAWRHLLQSHPHDSICGCATDTVAADTVRRCVAAIEVGEQVIARAASRLGLPAGAAAKLDDRAVYVAVIDPSGRARGGPLEAELDVPDGRAPVEVCDADGAPLPIVVELGEAREDLVTDIATPPVWPRRRRARIRTVVPPGPPGGWTTLRVALADDTVADVPGWQVDDGTTIAGGHLQVAADGDGTLRITDTRTGREIAGVGRLTDGGDRGDTYSHDAPLRDETFVTEPAGVVRRRGAPGQELQVSLAARLPAELSADRDGRRDERVGFEAELIARLAPDAEQVELELTWTNRADDHRLRLHVPTGRALASFVTDSALTWQRHPVPTGPPSLPADAGCEADPGTQPVHRLLAAGEGTDRVAVLVHGLHEAAAESTAAGTELIVTLLRAVGQLGHHDLRTRTMGAGPPVPTPQAQEHGRHHARLAVRLGDTVEQLVDAAWSWRTPRYALPLTGAPSQATTSGVAVDGAWLSAWKPAFDGDGWIVRVANPTPAARTATVRLPVAAAVVAGRLDETMVEPQDGRPAVSWRELAAGAPVTVALEPGGLATWRVRPATQGGLRASPEVA